MTKKKIQIPGSDANQLELFEYELPTVHYYDENGALHSGYLMGVVPRGKKKGEHVVLTSSGQRVITSRLRNTS